MDIKVDRTKQERLLTAFGPDRARGLMPCYGCRRFKEEQEMDKRGNGGVLFFEGREVSFCRGCSGLV